MSARASSVAAAEAGTSAPRDGENSVSVAVAAAAQAQAQAPDKGKEAASHSQRHPEPRTSLDPSEGAEGKPSSGVKIEGLQSPLHASPALTDMISKWRSKVPTEEFTEDLPELPPSVSTYSESSTTSFEADLWNPRRGFNAQNTASRPATAFLPSLPVLVPKRRRPTKGFTADIEEVQNPFVPMRVVARKSEISVAPVRGLKNGTNWVEWARFRSSLCIPEVFVIDVLVGKPVEGEILNVEGQKLYLDTLETDSLTNSRHLVRSLRNLGKGNQGSPRPPSQLQLPERIRINSRFLNGLIRSLEESPYSSVPDTDHRAIYYSPFHGLLALEEKLRDRLQTYSQASGPALIPSPVRSINRSHRSHASASGEVSGSDLGEVAGRNHSEKVQLGLLCGFIDEVVRRRLNYLADAATRLVYYSDLWHLFAPGALVLSRDDQQAYRVLSIESAGAPHVPCTRSRALRPDQFIITITLVYIDTDGYWVGPVTAEFKPPPFEGEMDITTFFYYPIRFSRMPDVHQKLIDRGRLFVDLLEMKHMHYTGLTLDDQYEVDCQVVVDNESALSLQGGAYASRRPQPRDLTGRFPQPPPATKCREFCCRLETARGDRQAEHILNAQYMDSLVPRSGSRPLPLAVTHRPCGEVRSSKDTIQEEELLIMSGRVFGFLLHSRRWAMLATSRLSSPYKVASETSQVHKIEGTIPLGESFDQLVLPPGHKELVKSLISQHFRDKKADRGYEQPDIVRGKGKGLILLLHGAPGVGKTTTAETVAEYFKKPLFHITCGDLGIWAKDVEESLERNFKLANRWGCILLLDEAEVFLAARTPKDHVRNSLVAVFLRVLEYYAGVLFVTTNRLGDFDEAFASRVHMSLYYPPLSLEATQQVLALNLNRARNRLLRQGRSLEINQFAVGGFLTSYWHSNPRGRWNGRQIRNACQTALALAEYDARSVEGAEDEGGDAAVVSLDVRHFQKVADAYMGFMNYMRDIYGADPDVRAAEMAIRAKPGSVDAASTARQGSFHAASAAHIINPHSNPPAAGGFFAPLAGQAQQQQQHQRHMGGGGGGTSHQPGPPQGANAGFMGAQGLSASAAAFEGAAANPYPQAQHLGGMFSQGFRPAPLSSHPQAASASAYQQYQWGASTNQNVMGTGISGPSGMPGASSPGVAMSAATAGLGPDLAAPCDSANHRREAGPEAGEQSRNLGGWDLDWQMQSGGPPSVGNTF